MVERASTQRAHTLDEILAIIQPLPIEQRVELVNRLLGESGLSVTPQNDCPLPVGTMGTNELGEILRAIAQKIENT
ncbi:hypothetical protein [Sphaerothrix gracilis]|uniref:hypothetical protein n=1 Tax=Sphaerothrix gracilis TaxID=3151835 RepID=UPI0031FC6228